MAFRLVTGGGNVIDVAMINMRCSGTIWPGGVVDLLPTSGLGVQAAGAASNQTTIFGVALDYREGASDAETRVIPFVPGQIWEAFDCARVAATAHINFKNILLDSTHLNLIGADTPGLNGIFEVLAVTSLSTASGRVLGRFTNFPRVT